MTGNVPHLTVIVSHAFDTFSQVDCVSGGIFGKRMDSHEQWLWTVFLPQGSTSVCYMSDTTTYSGIHRGYLPPSVAGSFQT